MQSSQVRNVGLPSCADTKRDVPAWTQDPKIFPLDWFSISRPNIIRQTKEYVSELSKWRNCPKIKTLSKLKAVLKRIMMFLHTHISYIDGKSLLECDLEEDLITLVSLYMDMELRVILIKKSAASGATTSNGPGTDTDSARNDKLVSDRISYWLYTVLTGHEQRVDALLSTTVYTRHTRPVLDPIFRKVLSEMPDGPFSNVGYVRNMLAYKTWRERTLVTDDVISEELNTRILQQLVPRDYAFPSPLLRCLGKGENARDHARPHNVNLADACRNFMRYCREIPATAAEQINFESIPLLDDEMLGDEENEVNNLMNMITNRKQRKTASASPRNSIQVDAFIDLTLPISKTKFGSSRVNSSSVAAVIDLTEEDEKPVITAPTSVVVEPSAAPSRVVSTVQRINASKKPQVTQECSYALTPSATQVETRCFTAYRDQDIYLVNISCMCPVRAHRQRECQCQDKKGDYYKENKALKTSKTERKYEKDATFVGRCFQFSIGNQYAYPSEDDVDTEIEPLVVGNTQDQVKLEMRSSTAVTCNTNEDTTQDETTEFCDKLFSASLNHCDCDGCKNQDTNLPRYENRTCASDKTSHGSANELSDNMCRRKPLVTCTQRVPHPTSVADMYAMEKASPIVLQSQQTAILSGNESNLEHFSETLDKRKVHDNDIQNTKIPKDNFVQNTENLSSNCLNEIQKIKLPVVDKIIEDTSDKFEPPVVNEDVYTVRINPITPTNTYEETVEYSKESLSAVIPVNTYEKCRQLVTPHISEETAINIVSTPKETIECRKIEISQSIKDISTNTYEKTIECEKVVIPHFSEENIYEERTECEKDVVSHCNEDITNNTISRNKNEETTEVLHSNEDISNCTMLTNIEEITKCKEDVTFNTNAENGGYTTLTNTYEESSEPEKVVLLHSNEKNSIVMSSNTDEEIAVSSHLSKEDFTQSTNISTVLSTENIEDIEVHSQSTNITAETTNFDTSTLQKHLSFLPNAQNEPLLPKSNSKIEIERFCNEVTQLGCSITPDIDQPNEKDSNEECLQNDLMEETSSVSETTTANLEKHSEEISEQPEETNHDVSTKNIETTVEEIVEHKEHCVHPIENSSNSIEFESIVKTSITTDESSAKEEFPNLLEIENVLPDDTSTVNPVEDKCVQQSAPETGIDIESEIIVESVPEIIVESVPEIRDISIQPSNDNQLENAESNTSNTELSFDEKAAITQDLHEDVPQTVIESEIVVESVPKIHEITIQPSNDNQLENVESNGSNTELTFDETATIKQDLHKDVHQTVIESEIVVESVPEIRDITIQPSNDSQNFESNGSNTELSIDETATITQDLNADVPQTIIESEIVAEYVPEIRDITIVPSNDRQLENLESNGSNTELTIDEKTTIKQDLHEDVPQTVIESEIVVESVPEIRDITIQPSNDSQLENVASIGSNTELTFDETTTIKQDLHEDVPQTVIVSEIVVESVPEISDITIQPSKDSQTENVESNSSNTELSFDETATITQDLHEDVPQTVIESVVESVPEIRDIIIEPSNDSQLENVESNSSNTELSFDETAAIKQDLHEDVPQSVIESEIVAETVPEIRDITIEPSNDSQLENVESNGSNTELTFDETATIKQDLHEDVPQTSIESEIVVESVPEIRDITIQPSNDCLSENVDSNGSIATITQNLHEDVPQTVIESEIVVEFVPEIHDITIQPSNDSQLENVESNGSNTELPFDGIATITQNLHEDVPQTVIESEIVVESVPEICDITIQPSIDSQLKNGSNTELSLDETATITQELQEDVPQTVNITSSDHVESKEKTSFVHDIQKNETVVISKNDEEILSPRKRRRRKPNLNMYKLIDEVKPAEPCDEILVTIDSLNENVSVNIEERKSLNDGESSDNLPEQPESIKPSTTKFEETQDISTTCQEISSDNTNLSILSKEIVSYDTKPIEPILEDTVSVQTSKSERLKRRRKQNLKNIREEKLTASIEDNSTVPQNQNKELVVVCKNLSQNEIDNLRINKSQTLSENITEERDEANIHLNVANQLSKDISTPNLNIVEAPLQPVILNEIKNETDLNIENNNANIEHSKNTLQSNNKEKPKQRTTNIKSRRKSKLIDNISDKIESNVVDRVINSTLVETLPITKLKRPRGRPSTKASRKLKFFSENLNLHNLDSSSTSSDKLNTTAQLDLSDEDVPLAYRVSQSTPQKINSLKSSNKIINKLRLSDVENELVKSEDELPLSARKQKTKPTKHPKNNSTTKAITKPKTFREKLQKFKFQARDKTEIIDNIKIQEEESDIFTLKRFNSESKPRKAVKTYSNTRALKTPKLFSVPEIIQASTIKPSKSILLTSPVKPKKSLRFSSEVTIISYNEEDIINPEAAKNINESKNSNLEESKNINSSLHRAEQIKINKFREISAKTDLLSFENPKIAAKTTQDNKNIEISTDLKSLTNNKEIKTETNLVLAPKKMLSKKAREKLFPETNENYKENKSKKINNTQVEETSFPENISSFEEKNNTLLSKSSSSEYKENESSIKIRKNNEHEIVNIDQKENSLNSPIKLKTDTSISSKDAEQEIIPENVPKKRRSKFPKLNLKRSSCSPKKLQNNIDSPPKKVTQFKKKNKIQIRLNGSNNKTRKVTSRRKTNKTESNVNVLQQDVIKCDSKDVTPDSIKDSVIDTTNKIEEKQNVEITKNISSLSSENESAELTNICAEKVEDKTDIPENIESANISSDMLYKPSNKIYEKNFEFYSDQDDVSNSELVIDTSAESSDAEDTKVENKLEIDEINQQIQNKVSNLNQIKYHHSIAEIINTTPVEDSTTESKSHISTQELEESLNEPQKENNSIDEKFDPSVISVSEETVTQVSNSEEKNHVILKPSEEIIENNTFQENLLSQETSVKHQESNIINNVYDSSSISIVEETVVEDMIVDESLITNEDHNNTVFDKNIDIQNTVEEKQTKIIIEELSAEILEISEEMCNELCIEKINEEKALQLIEPYAPSVEMLMNIEIGFESCTISQDKPLQEEHAKEGCVKCSVNGKHKDNKKVKVQGTHQYEENNVEECLEEHEIIPAIAYCQAVEILTPNLCICTAKDVTAQILTNNSPVVDNYNLCILADIAMSSIHLNTKTENNNVIQISGEGSNTIQTQSPLQKDERCVFVTFPDNAPTSSKPTIAISVIGSNNEEMSVNVQKIADGVNSKGNLLENKIQVLTERAKNGNRINGENLDELYRSLENICELEINTITKTSPKSDCHAAAPIPNETLPVNPKITEPNITIDIPNTALLHLTPDDDDFPIRNEPFSLQMPVVQSLETSAVPQIEKTKIDTAVVKNLYNELESITIDQKTPNSENENCESPKEAEQATKTKSKKGRSKSKTSNNQKSEASYLLNKYKSNQDSNTNNNRKNDNSSPTSYIRSTRPMRMVTTRKRNVNVLDNNCSPDEPAKKISASEKMFDILLEEHRKELSEAKLQNTTEETVVEKNVENVQTVSDTTMPALDDIPETPVISASIINTEESNIPLPVLNYEKQESNLKNEEIEVTKPDTSKDIAEKIETVNSVNDHKDDDREKISEEKKVEEIALEIPSDSEKDLVHKKTQSEDTELSQPAVITTACTETQIEKNTEEQEEEEIDRNTTAIEVVQDWFNRVDENKAQSESYTDITSIQTIEECNFFEEEVSSTSENSPNARKSDEKVFSEHQTPDSGIAFDEDSVQKDKSVPSDSETYCPTEPAITKTYFCNLNQSDGVKQIEISDIKLIKPSKSSEIKKTELKVSIELDRIKDILPLLTKYTPERKFKKRKELITETDKIKKRKYSLDETRVNIVSEETSNDTLIKDYKFKRRKHSNDDNILQECVIEDVMSPATSQRDMSSSIRTKGSVKEYPDLFGITESPVPSGSFHSPYPSDISITEEPTFSEECGIDLCNDYPCYDSFEVLQEQQSSQREYSVVDDNPKDVQQGIQAGYCVLDLQCLPISEYMNDGDYILVDNKIVNDKRMVLVNMQQVQPETKPHNPEEVKRSEFDDSEKEDSLSETVEEIIKNPSLFSEQTASEFQVISMDQATSEVQVVIACDNFQETEMTDNYLFGIALQNELTSSETPSTSAATEIQPTPMEIDETTPDYKIIEKSVELPTPEKDKQFNNINAVSQPVSVELLTAVNSISKSVGDQHIIENNEEIKQISKDKLTNTDDINETGEKSRKMSARKLSIEEQSQHFYTSRSPTSKLTTQAPSIKKSCYLKPSTQYEQGISDAKEVNKSRKELETKTYSLKTPDKNLPTSNKPPFKDLQKYDHQYGAKNNSNKTYPDHKPHASIQKPLKTDPITSHSASPASKKLNESKVPSKQYSPKTYRSKVSPDAFDRLKQDQTDITPPDSRTRYHSSTTDSNFMKNRYRKETALEYHRRHSLDRRSPRLKQISQSSSDSRRPQSAYTEPSPKPSYRLPPSDPTHRSSQYNNKKPDTKTSQSRMESKHSQSASSAHKDWLKNETLLNLIKTANNIYSKKY